MAFRSVIDIDINDDKFKKFSELYKKYHEQLANAPKQWQEVGKAQGEAAASMEEIAGYMASQNQAANQLARSTSAIESSFARSKKHVMAISAGLAEATRHLLRIGGIGGIAGGLLGVGGLWGMDRLGGGVASRRSTAVGLGSSYGGLSSFDINFGRVGNTGGILSGISAAAGDPSRIGPYAALGMSQSDLQGDSSAAAVKYLERLRGFAKRTSPSLLGTMSDAYGLGETGVSLEQLRRLAGMSDDEFNGLKAGYGKGKNDFGLTPKDQLSWQEFTTQMQRAGQQIETVFVRGLAKLAGPLDDLSKTFADMVTNLLGSDGFKHLMEEAGEALKHFSDYVGTPEFQKNVKSFAHDISTLAGAIGDAVHWIAGKTGGAGNAAVPGIYPDGAQASPNLSGFDALAYALAGKAPKNNPFNLTEDSSYGKGKVKFRQFGSIEESISATASQLERDEYVHHQNTLRQLVYGNKEWAGYSSTDKDAYFANLQKWTGIGGDEDLNFKDKSRLASVMSAISRQEGHPLDKEVIIKVLVEPGANVVSVTNAASK